MNESAPLARQPAQPGQPVQPDLPPELQQTAQHEPVLQDLRRRLRKNQITLMITGNGAIAFLIWNYVKGNLTMTFQDHQQELAELDQKLDAASLRLLLMFLGLFVVVIFGRIYVGLSARAEAKGKVKGPFYLLVAVMLAASSFFILSMELRVLPPMEDDSFGNILMAAILEFTSLTDILLLLSAAVRVRWLRRRIRQLETRQGEAHAA